MVDGGTRADAMVDGGTRADAMVDGGTRADAMVDGGTRADAMVDGGTRADAMVDGGTRADARPIGSLLPSYGPGSSSAPVLVRQGCASPGPALPSAIWRIILGFLSTPRLMRAAPTCRLFAEVLAERVRETINCRLTAAERKWGVDVLQRSATAVSLARFGLDPFLLQALPQAPPHEDLPHGPPVEGAHQPHADAITLGFAGVGLCPGGALKPVNHIKTWHKPAHRLSRGLYVHSGPSSGTGSVAAVRPVRQSRQHAPCADNGDADSCVPFRLHASAPPQGLRNAIGLLLAARVERQQVVREGPGSLRVEVQPAWWVEDGDLCAKALLPTISEFRLQDRGAGESPIAKFERLDERLKGALSDALAAAAALQRCLVFMVQVEVVGGDWAHVFSAHLAQRCRCSPSSQSLAR